MNRRKFLAWALAGTAGGLAGCAGARSEDRQATAATRDGSGGSEGDTASPTRTRGSSETTAGSSKPSAEDGKVESVGGAELPLPMSELSRGAGKDAIPAITEPAFAPDWSGLTIDFTDRFGNERTMEPRLTPEDRVIGVTRGGEARAYPFRILNWHEIANDSFDGPLLVTYCPLCGSGITAERTVDGEETIFGVSGLLWNSDLVMYDQLTESLWAQIAATAIRGPRTGDQLTLVPSSFTTWGTWKDDHPDTTVLLPPPESSTIQGPEAIRDYRTNPYGGYERSSRIGIGENDVPESDADLHPKAQVLGVTAGDAAKAYPLEAVAEAGVVNDTVGGLPVVVSLASDDSTLVAYDRRVDGSTLRFEKASDTHLRADGSRWKITTGRAVDGPHEGTTLTSVADKGQMFWFAWLDFHPETTVYGEEE